MWAVYGPIFEWLWQLRVGESTAIQLLVLLVIILKAATDCLISDRGKMCQNSLHPAQLKVSLLLGCTDVNPARFGNFSITLKSAKRSHARAQSRVFDTSLAAEPLNASLRRVTEAAAPIKIDHCPHYRKL